MRFDLFIDGKVYNVELDIGKLITIEIDGKTFQAETKKTDTGLTINVDKKEFIVRFEGKHISIDGQKHTVEVHNLRRGRPSWYNVTEKTADIKVDKPAHKIPGGEGMIHRKSSRSQCSKSGSTMWIWASRPPAPSRLMNQA